MNALAYISGGIAFLKEMAAPRDPIALRDGQGLTLLNSWKRIPEKQALALSHDKIARRQERDCRNVLYCYQGPHLGECFFVRGPQTRVSSEASADIVLTPADGSPGAEFLFTVDADRTHLTTRSDAGFVLNGNTTHEAYLVDFDEVLINGNRFLVLDIPGGQS